jgi:hypothetical protein
MTQLWNTGSSTYAGDDPDFVDEEIDATIEDEGDDEESSEDVGEDDDD